MNYIWSMDKKALVCSKTKKTNGLFGLGSQDRSGRGGEVLLSEMCWSGKMNWTAVLITERGRDPASIQTKSYRLGFRIGSVEI
jgi:hypothetical protein